MPRYRLALAPDIAAIPRLAEWIEACCSDNDIGPDATFKLTLVLEEAVANVIHHGFAGAPEPHRLSIELRINADRLAAEVIDNGPAFDPLSVSEPDRSRPLEERDPGGLGIHLIRNMMDRVSYRRVAGENRLLLEKARA